MAKTSSRQEGQDSLSKRMRKFGNDYMTLLRSGPVLQLQQMADEVVQLEAENERLMGILQEHAEYDHQGNPINWCADALKKSG